MGGPQGRRRHGPDRRLWESLRGKGRAAQAGGETGESGRLPDRHGADEGEGGKGLRTSETVGPAARVQSAGQEHAGPEQEPVGDGASDQQTQPVDRGVIHIRSAWNKIHFARESFRVSESKNLTRWKHLLSLIGAAPAGRLSGAVPSHEWRREIRGVDGGTARRNGAV